MSETFFIEQDIERLKKKSRKIDSITSLVSTVIVASSNSSAEDKLVADFICDGVNDEVELQMAVDMFSEKSGKVLLCNGDYYIDSLKYSGSATYGYYGIMIANENDQREIIIEGVNAPYRTTGTMGITGSPVLHLTQSAYNLLGGSDKFTMIGAIPNITTGLFAYPGRSLITKNIGIMFPNNQKKVSGIDAFYCTIFKCDSIIVSLDLPMESFGYAVSGCTGISGLSVGMFGEGYRMDNCFVYGMRIAYNCGGEHLIAQDLGARFCVFPFLVTNGIHPNTFINCCDESCTKSIRFTSNINSQQSCTLIDYNCEYDQSGYWMKTELATEETIGAGHGVITYTNAWAQKGVYSGIYKNEDSPFWEKGHGLNFKTTNTNDLLSGTTTQRPSMPNLYQHYIDTTLTKEIVLKTLGSREVETLTINSVATTSGNITITLDGVATNIAIASGDSTITIANKIRLMSSKGWFVSTGTTNVITFTKVANGTCSVPVFSGGSTGVAGAFTTVAGVSNTWMDAMGTTV